MYPWGCKDEKVHTELLVYKDDGCLVKNVTYTDWIGFGHTFIEKLPCGRYEIIVKYNWVEFTVKDYTVRVYAEEQVEITD